MEKDIARVLLSEEQIQKRVAELGAQLSEDYRGKTPTMVCILKGSIMFYTDLVRAMPIPLAMDFMAVSSYGNRTKSSGEVEIRKDLSTSIEGKDVVIVEDIVDSGNTLSRLVQHFNSRGAKSVKTCTLLDKPSRRKVEFEPDYVGTVIPDEFVFGYGLDLFEKYRDLPYVAVVSEEYLASLNK